MKVRPVELVCTLLLRAGGTKLLTVSILVGILNGAVSRHRRNPGGARRGEEGLVDSGFQDREETYHAYQTLLD